MIKAKPKECSRCSRIEPLWVSSPKLCRSCASQVKHNTISQDTAPSKPIYRTKEIKKVSTRQQKLNALYSVLATQFKKNHPVCEARIKCVGSPTTDVHHKRGRGEYLLKDETFLASCRACHQWIGENHAHALALGLSESRLDKHNNE